MVTSAFYSCASMWNKGGDAKRGSWFHCSLCDDLHDAYMKKLAEDCAYLSLILLSSIMKLLLF